MGCTRCSLPETKTEPAKGKTNPESKGIQNSIFHDYIIGSPNLDETTAPLSLDLAQNTTTTASSLPTIDEIEIMYFG
jgi:hypothetical protein